MKVLLLLGLIFLLAGLAVGLLLPRALGEEGTAVSLLTPLTFDQLQETAVGTPILLEGSISPDNLQQDGLVLYNTYRQGTGGADDWQHVGSNTPPFAMQIPGGLVYIRNTTYDITRTSHSVQNGSTEYSGLARYDPVVVLGAVVELGEAPTINADTVAFGTQADQVAELARASQVWVWVAGILEALGLALLVMAAILWLSQP